VTSRAFKGTAGDELEVNWSGGRGRWKPTGRLQFQDGVSAHFHSFGISAGRGYEVAYQTGGKIAPQCKWTSEPIEKVVFPFLMITPVSISKLISKGIMTSMSGKDGYSKLEYLVPTRGLLGYRTEFINDTRGEGTLVRRFECFEPHKGEIPQRTNGAVVAQEEGIATPYALYNISERAILFIEPGTKVYEGMIVGMNSRSEDMVVNACKAKKTTNMRAAGSDEAIKLSPARIFTLEEALEFINDDVVWKLCRSISTAEKISERTGTQTMRQIINNQTR